LLHGWGVWLDVGGLVLDRFAVVGWEFGVGLRVWFVLVELERELSFCLAWL